MPPRRSKADFTAVDRLKVLDRDGRCVVTNRLPVTIQHRRAKGMGGIGDRHPKLTPADGLCLLGEINDRVERDMQLEAIWCGWKIPRNEPTPADDIPYFEKWSGTWWLPDTEGGRRWIFTPDAQAMMRSLYARSQPPSPLLPWSWTQTPLSPSS